MSSGIQDPASSFSWIYKRAIMIVGIFIGIFIGIFKGASYEGKRYY